MPKGRRVHLQVVPKPPAEPALSHEDLEALRAGVSLALTALLAVKAVVDAKLRP